LVPPGRGRLLNQIESLRGRLVGVLGLIVAVVTLLPTVIAPLFPSGALDLEPTFSMILAIEAALALATAVLARMKHRQWAARLLALDLIVLPTIEVLNSQTPLEAALAGYVGVILVLAIGTQPFEVLAGTLTVSVLGALAVWSQAEVRFLPVSLISVCGLLGGVGVVLSWLVDSLRRSIVGLEASEAHFRELSHTDALTGLGNRRLFDETLVDLLSVDDPMRSPALVVLDVDTLKQINDRHGHPAGDGVLKSVAAAIQGSIRDLDIACRVGGDEFAVILAAGGLRGAEQIASRIRERLPLTLQTHTEGIPCTVSIGLAERTQPLQTPGDLLAAADSHLYAGRFHVREPVHAIPEPPSA